MPNLLIEIGTEELPAGYIDPALDYLKGATAKTLAELRLSAGAITVEGTPRRLSVIVEDVADKQEDFEEEVTGPKKEIAWKDGALSKAGEGFLRGRGLTEADAYEKETKKGVVIAARVKEVGQPAAAVIAPKLAELIRKTPFQKQMRWGDESERFARPVQWLCGLFGDEPLAFSFAGVDAAPQTFGHRFHAPDAVEVKSVEGYQEALKNGRVTLSRKARRERIESEAKKLAEAEGGRLREDPALIHLVSGLVEQPWPLLGRFDAKFLEVPRELLISEMREHQKYFAVENENGELLPCFVVVAGSEPVDRDATAQGHARVLRSRFEDGAFYFDSDKKRRLEERSDDLKSVLFQRDLGTIADKVARIGVLVGAFAAAAKVSDEDAQAAARAAALCKNDLTSGVVGEFPELQGVMGRVYALLDGEDERVAHAIEDHYAPRHAGDALARTDAGAIVGAADRLDTLVGIIGVGKAPTGSADPFALRRAAIALLHTVLARGWRIDLAPLVDAAVTAVGDRAVKVSGEDLANATNDLIQSRLRGVFTERLQQRDVAPRGDVIDGVVGAGTSDLVATEARAIALCELAAKDAEAFDALAAVFKRVANILRQAREKGLATDVAIDPSLFETDSERALFAAAETLSTTVDASAEDRAALLDAMRAAFAQVATLKAPLATFFDDVMVMAEDERIRDNRLALLARAETAIASLCDFTRVQAEA